MLHLLTMLHPQRQPIMTSESGNQLRLGACLASTRACTVNVSVPAREIDAFLKGRVPTDLEEG